MEYNKIIAVTGLPGLYELVSSKSDGAIVRSLDDKSTRFVSSRVHNFSHLESIEIYTIRENVNLVDVLTAMDKKGGSLPDVKNNDAIKEYFQNAYPDMDFERVYTSDMKKMVKWFEILKKSNVEIKLSEAAVEDVEATNNTSVVAVEEKLETPKKAAIKEAKEEEKAPKKKAAVKKEEEEKLATAKKVAAPKKEKEEAPKKKAAAPKAKKEETEESAEPKRKAAPKKK